MVIDELCWQPLASIARLLASREVSPVSLVEAVLGRIERVDNRLHAFTSVMADRALAAAREAEQAIGSGGYRGPLHGVPISLKDIVYLRGVPNTGSSPVFADFIPSYDATVATRLDDAGAIIVGKTRLWELAMFFEPDSPYPHARNPWNPARATMGSSSGSAAAVAAGLGFASIGSDTGGSIRSPASSCGVVGFKPTYGRVSRSGVTPASWSLDHVGPLTRTVFDAALVLNVIAGFDPNDGTSLPSPVPDYTATLNGQVEGLRVGVPEHLFDGIDPEFARAIDDALEVFASAGASVERVVFPFYDEGQIAQSIIVSAEFASVHEERVKANPGIIGANARTRMELGSLLLATDYLKAQRMRALFQRGFLDLMDRVDVLVTPTSPAPPPRLDEPSPPWDWRQGTDRPPNRFRWPFNLVGAPSISVPCGFTGDGLPIGLQISGRPLDDGLVLNVAHAYEQRTEWHRRRPPGL